MADDPLFDPRATTVPVLRYLVALAGHRHFGRAARAAQVSQSSLSGLVAQWERRMGCQVVERNRQGVRLTPAGERVAAAAERALAAIEAVERAAAEAKPPFYGPVRLGVIPTIAPYALPFVTGALEKAYPDLELPVREAPTAELVAALDAGRIDVALLALLAGFEERYAVEALYDEPFLAALPRGHRLARRARVAADDLARERLLLLDEGHCLRDQALALCRRRAQPQSGADYRATSLETLRQIVATGAGVTVLPVLAAGADNPRLVLRPMADDPPAQRTIVLVWRRGDARAEGYARLGPAIRRYLPRERLRIP